MKQSAIAWLALLTVLLFTGCQSAPSVNWDSRVGNFTFDQAVIELGPPDSQVRLDDGRTVAKWVHRYSNNGGVLIAGGGFHSSVIETAPTYYETALILTFRPDKILATWSRR